MALAMAQSLRMTLVACQRLETSAAARESHAIETLTRGLASADEEAYRNFFELYARRLLLYALVLTNGHEESAKDLLQLTMIRVTKYARVFEREDEFWSWLTRLARSAWIDEHRKKRRYWRVLAIFGRRQTEEIEIPVPVEPSLPELLDRLDPHDRQLLEEKYLQGKSVKQIAAEAGSSQKAVESQLTRARERLRKLMWK